ncbi:PRC-barrel domain-containing protein [Streptomyces sp. NPDC059629]|uniref:PRC-barrel domain-containing protein n=1 Tax=Streptomyces sp. NPDC059629 TaxID=3346889 RepID=UPI0036A140AA
MLEAGDIREWRGHDEVDATGHKIGVLESVYVDTATDKRLYATVTVGLPTRRRPVFVPLVNATVGPGCLRVAFDKGVVRKAPAIDTDGELPASREPAVFAHYDLDYAPGTGGERRFARR